MWEADRLKDIPLSGIRQVLNRATELEKQGHNVIHLEIGRPDFDTPIHIKEAAKKALDEGYVHYVSNYGIPPLRDLIAKKMKSENGVTVDPAKEILITTGATEALYLVLSSILNPGDEILVSDPSWINYLNLPKFLDLGLKTYQLKETHHFCPDLEQIKSLINSRTKMIIICTPHNPTGSVLAEEEIKQIAQLALEHNLIVLSDEVYEKIIYDDAKHISMASLKELKDRVVTINAFSKTYSMTGWRLGYVIAPPEAINAMIRNHQLVVGTCCSFAQKGAMAALSGPQEPVRNMVAEFRRRRNLVVEKLNEIPKIQCQRPRGAFYVYANISATGLSGEEFTMMLLERHHVATVPGSAFGRTGKNYIRISYATAQEQLIEAMQRIGNFVRTL